MAWSPPEAVADTWTPPEVQWSPPEATEPTPAVPYKPSLPPNDWAAHGRQPAPYQPDVVGPGQPNRFDTIAQNATDALVETAGGFIPKSLRQVVDLITPLGGAVEGFEKLYGVGKDLARGSTVEHAVDKNYPESRVLVEADKTPPFSKERFAAGFGMLANLGMLYAGGRGLAKEFHSGGLSERLAPITGEKPATVTGEPADHIAPPEPIATHEATATAPVAGTGQSIFERNAKNTVDALRHSAPQTLEHITDLHAQDFTAQEIADKLGMDVSTVRDARVGLGLPPQAHGHTFLGATLAPEAGERAAFEAWRDNRKTTHEAVQPETAAGTAPEAVSTGESATASQGEAAVGAAAQPVTEQAPVRAAVDAAATVAPEAGTVRLYHGAAKAAGQAGSDFTPNLEYAKGYAEKSGDGGQVWYVDVPEDSPFLKRDEGAGNVLYNRQSVPDAVADAAKPHVVESAKPSDLTPALRTESGVITGEQGQTHQNIYDAQPDPVALRAADPEHGFVDTQGNFKTHEEAAAALGLPEPLQSERLIELQKTTPTTGEPTNAAQEIIQPESVQAKPESGIAGGQTQEVSSRDSLQPATQGEARQIVPEPQSPTGIRNAIVDQQRVERGLPERMAPIRKTNPEAWDAAMAKVDKNPNAGRELVADIQADPRALEPEESALLAHEQVTRENAFDNAVDAVNNAKTDSDRLAAQQRLDSARNDVQEVYDAGQRVGTKSGQSLQARKLLVNQDYTLARMEAVKRAVANDGKPLSESQLEEVKAAHEKIAELQSKLDAQENAVSQEKQLDLYRQIVKENMTAAKESAKQGKSLQATLDSAAEKARARIIARRGRLQITIDPLNVAGLVDEAIIGASHIARGLTEIGEWSKQMVKDFGERINPYLKDLWDRAKQYHDAHVKLFDKTGDKGTRAEALAAIKPDAKLTQKQVYDLARAHVNEGVEGLDNVMQKVTADLQSVHPGISEREVRDTFTDYGKRTIPSPEADRIALREYRRLGQLVSAIEDARAKEYPQKSGMQRDKPSQAIREKTKELKAAMEASGLETASPEEQIASTNQARATSLRNQIEDLEKEIATGQRVTAGVPKPDSPEVTALKVRRDALKEQLSGIREADPSYVAEQQDKALSRYKSIIQKRTADIQTRIAAGDYTKPTRNKTQLDDAALKARSEYETERQKWETQVEKDRLAKRPLWLKGLEQIAGTARASALSGYHTLLKLATYDLAKFIETPITEVAGAGISKIPGLRGIAAKANLESGSTIRPLVDFYTQASTKGAQEAWRVLRTGKTEAKTLYGKTDYSPPKWFDFPGNVHMAEKSPLLTGTHAMYLRRAIENAIKEGLDPSNEFTRAAINKAVYDHSQKAILQENNAVASAVNQLHTRMEAENPKTGQVDIAKATLSTLFKTFITKGIVRTPANYIAQTIARTPVGLATGLAKAGVAHARGIQNLHAIEANAIQALLKTGAVGSAMFIWGAIDATKDEKDRVFGGYWNPGRKRGGDDVDWGKIRVGEKQLPHIATHNPLTESAQMGSTMIRVAMSRFRKKDEDTQGMMKGAVQAIVGLGGKAPIASPIMRAGQGRSDVGADLLSGLVPQLLQNIAEDTDSEERKPQNTLDRIKATIPGLRQDVPVKP